ncbi:MAG: hypothetical protein ACLSH8_06025 [Zhenhengia sp.]|jgi:hypothetical protein|uniref:hypothetical protein n=1 Tax=Zhenhengia sp. TaxID=2944208 RepID=UPI003996192A
MKEAYNLKKVIDKQLKEVHLNAQLEESIKAKCLDRSTQARKKIYSVPKVLAHVAVWIIGILFVFSGTAYAINHVEGFSMFIGEKVLKNIAPHVQTINKEDHQKEVKMVVEAAIADHYNSLLVFSFINEGKEPWTKGVKVGSWDESWTVSREYGPPILSEDGRKLTYYVESSGNEDILEGKKFILKASNIIQKVEVEEEIDIPLGELFQAHNTVLDTIDYDYPHNSKYLYMKLDRLLHREIGDSQRIVLREEPLVTFEYVGLIQDSRLEDPMNPDGGLTLYTRNASDKYWTGTSHDYVIGTISEITDIRTGKVYTAHQRSINYDMATLWRGSLGTSQFSEIMDPADIPYLKATKVTYEVQEVLTKQDWKVEFDVQDTTTIEPIQLNLGFDANGESIQIQQMNISVMGITLTGTKTGKPKDPKKDSIYEQIKVEMHMQDGSIIPFINSDTTSSKDKFKATCVVFDDKHDRVFLDIEKIDKIFINGEQVWSISPSM